MILTRRATLAMLGVWPSAVALAQTTVPSSGLQNLLDTELARFSGTGGIYVHHLKTGARAGVRADEKFDSASTIKLAIMILAYRLQDEKKLDLDDRHTITPAEFRGGSGVFRYQDPGLNPTLRDVLTQMVITSDNTATDIMIEKVGGTAAINAFLKEAGYTTLRFNMTTNDYFRRPYDLADPKNGLTPEDVFALYSNHPAFVAGREALLARWRKAVAEQDIAGTMRKRASDEQTWLGIVTPAEMGRLLETIENETAASPEACAEMKRIMRAQLSGARKMRHWLTVPIAHKTGETTGVTNDVGMIYARSGPIIVAFYTMGYEGNVGEADDRLGHVARLIVAYFDGTA